jgi:hypothetical protein
LRAGRERIDDEQVNPSPEEVDRLGDKFAHGNPAGLVSGRHHLDHRHHFAQVMPHNHPVGPFVKPSLSELHDHSRPRSFERGRRQAATRGLLIPTLDRVEIRMDGRCVRFHETRIPRR